MATPTAAVGVASSMDSWGVEPRSAVTLGSNGIEGIAGIALARVITGVSAVMGSGASGTTPGVLVVVAPFQLGIPRGPVSKRIVTLPVGGDDGGALGSVMFGGTILPIVSCVIVLST
jgi:hypothetical protein